MESADELAAAIRNHPRTHAAQPAKVRMTEELERVLKSSELAANHYSDVQLLSACKSVRAQAAEAGKVRMPKVRDGVTLLLHKAQRDPRVGLNHYETMLHEMLAELDAAEGRKP